MVKTPIHIKFQNRQNPKADFDIIPITNVFNLKNLNHSPLQLHLVEFYIIIFIEEGEGTHTIDFINYSYQKGSILTIRKDQIHKFHLSQNAKGSLLLFTDNFLVSYLEKLEALKALQLFNEILSVPKIQLTENDFSKIVNLIQHIKNEYFDTNDTYSLGIIRSLLHILITKLYRIKAQYNAIIFNRKYLSEFVKFQYLVEQNVTKSSKVKYYASLLNISTKTLNTITRTIVNKSAKQFIDDICTQQIKRLLINTEHSVKEIAYISGFEETTNFYKYFKRQTLMTPEQFRNNYS